MKVSITSVKRLLFHFIQMILIQFLFCDRSQVLMNDEVEDFKLINENDKDYVDLI